jgi:hypothetical protein
MSVDLVKFAFIAGEISPTLFGRTDLTKFDFGMAEATNFFVDYRGGLSTRPGTEFFEYVKEDARKTRYFPFTFSVEEEDTHIILFGHNYIRFLQGGNYILSAAVACTTAGGTVTAVGHGLTEGRWIKSGGISYRVGDVTSDTFNIYTIPHDEIASSVSFTSYQPVYEIASPFSETDLDDLHFNQYRDVVKITSPYFPPHDLTRLGEADWTLTEADISKFAKGPSITGGTSSSSGNAQVIFAVTKTLEDGTESISGNPFKLSNIVNYTATEGSVSISWAPADDAVSYSVYRSIVSTNEVLSFGSELGYVGRTKGTKFTDPNIVPDFGRAPSLNRSPFTPGAITSVRITDGGNSYTSPPTVSATGGGTGFTARAIIDDAGKVVNVLIENGGAGYVNPTITFTGGGGSGATATATARALTGTYPSLSIIFQQRQLYAASLEQPITIWGSQIGRFDNFNRSELVLATDAYDFTLDSSGVSPIRHLFQMRGGLMVMTAENIWLLSGGNNNQSLTPTNALAEPQTYTGASKLQPIRVGTSILYTEGKGYAVRELLYNEFSRVYSGQDRSILANHLFGPGKEIIAWGFQESPYKVVWSIRRDGKLLAFTTVPDEDVFAWTSSETQGRFTDLVVIREGTEDRVYLMAERFIAGRWTKFVERMDLRQFTNIEDAWCVDCGLQYPLQYPPGTVTVHKGNYATIEGGSFSDCTGAALRLGNGLWRVTSHTSTRAELIQLIEPTTWVPETDKAYTFPATEGEWSLTMPVNSVSGLHHLEGEMVSILADGNMVARQRVVDGQIHLEEPASRIIVGLRFTCKAKTLPLIAPEENIEAKRKRIIAVTMRLTNSRALKVGDSYDTVYEFPARSDEPWGNPIRPLSGIAHTPVGSSWDEDSFTYFLLDDPLPATLLSLVQSVEVGDEGN